MTKEKKYPGQKKINGVYHKIINNIPEHKFYYELFAGSAAIAKLLMPVSDAAYYLNDIDSNVIKKLRIQFSNEKRNIVLANEPIMKVLNVITKHSYDMYAPKDYFLFLDPPYLHETRPNNTKLYKHEMIDEQHKNMLLSVCDLNCNVMIIHPQCNIYDTMLKGWRKVQIKIRYHGKTSIECLYMNYPKPRKLQTDIYLGSDCWDRQRILRKSIRWTNRFKKLPPLERNFILNKLKKISQ